MHNTVPEKAVLSCQLPVVYVTVDVHPQTGRESETTRETSNNTTAPSHQLPQCHRCHSIVSGPSDATAALATRWWWRRPLCV